MPNPPIALTALAAGLMWLAPATSCTAQPSANDGREIRKLDSALAEQFGVLSHIRPSREAVMGFGQPTKVTELFAKGGQEVTKGQNILRGDDAEDQAMLELQKISAETDLPVQRAKAEMDQAELEWLRLKDLVQKNAASKPEEERARLAYDVKRLEHLYSKLKQTQEVIQVKRMQARVDRLNVTAPFDGTVDNIQVDVGQSVSENDKIVRVVNVETLMIDVGAEIGDARTLGLNVGDPAWVLVDMAGTAKLRQAKVTEVSPTADLGSRTRRIRVEFPNPKGPERVLPGGPAWVRFSEPSAELLTKFSIVGVQARADGQPQNPAH